MGVQLAVRGPLARETMERGKKLRRVLAQFGGPSFRIARDPSGPIRPDSPDIDDGADPDADIVEGCQVARVAQRFIDLASVDAMNGLPISVSFAGLLAAEQLSHWVVTDPHCGMNRISPPVSVPMIQYDELVSGWSPNHFSLGPSPLALGWGAPGGFAASRQDSLWACVPTDWQPTVGRRRMRACLIPEWEAARNLSWAEANRAIDSAHHGSIRGLYWEDARHQVLVWSLVTAHAFAGVLPEEVLDSFQCGFSAAGLRDAVEGDFKVVSTDVDPSCASFPPTSLFRYSPDPRYPGMASMSGGMSPLGYSARSLRSVVACPSTTIFSGVVADYYLWWAWRLFDFGISRRSARHVLLAVLSARSALSEVVRVAGFLIHEFAHIFAPESGHCEGGSSGRGLFCCTHWTQEVFINILLAQLGLPVPPGYNGSQDATRGGWYGDLGPFRIDTTTCQDRNGNSRIYMQYNHCNRGGRRHPMVYTWKMDTECTGQGEVRGEAYVFDNRLCTPNIVY